MDTFIVEGNTLVSYRGHDETVKIPKGFAHIGEDCFSGSEIKEVILTEDIETIGARAFQDCSLEKIEFREGLRFIGEEAFWGCNLKSVFLPETLEALGKFAFAHSSLVTATVPGGIKRIPEGCFAFCPNLEVLNLGSVEILEACCYGCTNLRHVNIPDSVRRIQHSMSRELYLKNGHHLECFEFCDKLTLHGSEKWQKEHPYIVLRLKKYLECPRKNV